MRLVLPALFPLFSKIDVNGKNADPLFVYLKAQQGGFLGDDIKWNFTKFLVSRDGTVVDRYAPVTKPEKIEEDGKGWMDNEEEVRGGRAYGHDFHNCRRGETA